MTILTIALSLLVQEQVDNPEFKGWSAFKPGSSVTYKVQINQSPGAEQKLTLKSVGDGEVVLETEMSSNGQVIGKAMERKVPAKVPAEKAPRDVRKGEEEIEVAGKTIKCTTREFETTAANGKKFQMKVWAADEIPGKAAKVEVAGEGFKNTMVASAWEKK